MSAERWRAELGHSKRPDGSVLTSVRLQRETGAGTEHRVVLIRNVEALGRLDVDSLTADVVTALNREYDLSLLVELHRQQQDEIRALKESKRRLRDALNRMGEQ